MCMPLDFLGLCNRAVASPTLVYRFTVLIKHPGLSSVRSEGRESAAPDRGTDTLEGGRRAQPPPRGYQPLRHSAGDRAGHREPLIAQQIRNMVPAEGTEPWRMIIKLLAASQAAKQTRSKSTRFCLQSGGPPSQWWNGVVSCNILTSDSLLDPGAAPDFPMSESQTSLILCAHSPGLVLDLANASHHSQVAPKPSSDPATDGQLSSHELFQPEDVAEFF